MSKVFITKNGQFVSRGEGVLTRIENPDLEVNDIGVEVSERIAEDVKEGDVLFQQSRSFKTPSTFHPSSGAHFIEMFEHQGGLYCLVVGAYNSGPQWIPFMIFKYENGTWNNYIYHYSQYLSQISTTNDNRGCVQSIGDTIYVGLEYGANTAQKYGFYRVRNREVEQISDHLTDPINAYYPPGASNNYGSYDSGMAELSGMLHYGIAVRNGSTDTPTSSIALFKYDPETESGSALDVNYSGLSAIQATDKCDMVNYNGDLYFAITHQNIQDDSVDGSYYNWTVFKYNQTSDQWDFFCIPLKRHPFPQSMMRFRVLSDGLYLAAEGDYQEEAIFKLNESTNKFDDFWINDTTNPQGSVRLEEVNGKKYLITSDQVHTNTSGLHIKEYNTSTSSFVEFSGVSTTHRWLGNVGSIPIYSILGTYVSGSDILIALGWEIDFNFYKFNTDTSSFQDLNVFKLRTETNNVTDLDFIDYNGSSIMAMCATSNQRIGYDVYNPITKNWDHMQKPDTYISTTHNSISLFETGGSLYSIASEYISNLTIHKLDESTNQFLKLADPSSIPSFTGYPFGLDTVALDASTQLVALMTSRDLLLFNFSNDTLTSATGPSGLITPTTADANQSEVSLYDLSGDIFLSVAWNNNNSTSMNFSSNIQSFKYDGSGGWSNIAIEYPVSSIGGQVDAAFISYLNRQKYVKMFEQGGDFWMMTVGYSSPENRLFKYENGSWVHQMQNHMDYGSNGVYGYDTVSYGTSQWFFKGLLQSGATFSILERKTNGSFITHQCSLETPSRAATIGAHVVDGKLVLMAYPIYDMQGPVVLELVDYPKELVWYHAYDNMYDQTQTLAEGIALQDGSKGDIIKIRRIKQ